MLYLQIVATSANPNGCWDWWGYTGEGYYGQSGKQMRAVKAMVDRIFGAPDTRGTMRVLRSKLMT